MKSAEEKKKIYTVATTHLDTSWSWRLETTLDDYLPKTAEENFPLFEKYPDYVFSFEGAYRYALLEEYYPALFEKVSDYISRGRWFVAGSAYENGDVNIPSPEALFRNILYGNGYFREKFGKSSVDLYLPDCFGFGYALPAVAQYSGLCGFTTQKLRWGTKAGLPFDIGVWRGVGGSKVFAAIDAGDYNKSLKRVRGSGFYQRRLRANGRQFGLPVTTTLHGVGDRGGAPREKSVAVVCGEAALNGESDTEIVIASTDRLFRELSALDEKSKKRLPSYDGEFLMTDHGAGCYTAATAAKRLNRRCELIADAAERAGVTARLMGAQYPQAVLDAEWKRIVSHQFHDDITGTSISECRSRAVNDYFISLGKLSEELRASAAIVLSRLDTSYMTGCPVAVFNPFQGARRESVTARVRLPGVKNVRVFDCRSNETASQLVESDGEYVTVVFLADIPSTGFALYDVREADSSCGFDGLRVGGNEIENEKYIVRLDSNGDIASVFDKEKNRELLRAPIRTALLSFEGSPRYPAWELDYKELKKSPRRYPALESVRVVENGAARVALEVVQSAGKSRFVKKISLSRGEAFVRVDCETDWRETCCLAKEVFPLTVSNAAARFDLGLGFAERPVSQKKQYEVPAQQWVDVSENGFGVSVFSDSRVGWDRPDVSTLRLTSVFSPRFAYRDSQHLLDFGINRFSYGLFSHSGSAGRETVCAAARFNMPPVCFAVPKTEGSTAEFSLCSIDNDDIIIRAVKKAQASDETVVRFNDECGRGARSARFSLFGGIDSARELFADETEKNGDGFSVENGELVFDMKPFEVRTFALASPRRGEEVKQEHFVALEHNIIAATSDAEREKGELGDGLSFSTELLGETVKCGGVSFRFEKESEKNAVVCRGQKIFLPSVGGRLYFAAASLSGDRDVRLLLGEKEIFFRLHSACEAVGAWDMLSSGETGYVKHAVVLHAASHCHSRQGDLRGKQMYVFKYGFDIPEGVDTVTLPDDEDFLIFAATQLHGEPQAALAGEIFDSLEKRPCDFEINPKTQARSVAGKGRKRKSKRRFWRNYIAILLRRELAQLRRTTQNDS